jgi:ribonuclease HII
MGYGTAFHEAMVKKHGRIPAHRNSFKFSFEKEQQSLKLA